jgi:hypothetical protein
MTSTAPAPSATDPIAELRDWLADNWDPDLSVGEWWERLGLSGWAAPLLPVDCYGRGMNRSDALRVGRTIAESARRTRGHGDRARLADHRNARDSRADRAVHP